jgi:hypothetical protein
MTDFQSSVRYDMTYGVPGDLRYDGPMRADRGFLNSASAAYNIVGATAFTQYSDGTYKAGGVIANDNPFGGILCNPKVYASYGTTANGPLAATTTLANNVMGEFLQSGYMVASIGAACNPGDWLLYDNTTGALSTIDPVAVTNVTIAITTGIATVNSITAGSVGVGTVLLNSLGNKVATITALIASTGGVGFTGTYTTDNVAGVSAAAYTSVTVPAVGKSRVPNGVVDKVPQTGAGLILAKLTN